MSWFKGLRKTILLLYCLFCFLFFSHPHYHGFHVVIFARLDLLAPLIGKIIRQILHLICSRKFIFCSRLPMCPQDQLRVLGVHLLLSSNRFNNALVPENNALTSSALENPQPAHRTFLFQSTKYTYPSSLFTIPNGSRTYSKL